jgi:hypothetical protein
MDRVSFLSQTKILNLQYFLIVIGFTISRMLSELTGHLTKVKLLASEINLLTYSMEQSPA